MVMLYDLFLRTHHPDDNTLRGGINYFINIVGSVVLLLVIYSTIDFYPNFDRFVNDDAMNAYLDNDDPDLEGAKSAIEAVEQALAFSLLLTNTLSVYKSACFGLTMAKSSTLFTPAYVGVTCAAMVASEVPLIIAKINHERPD
jgi:hypothetical protein